MSFHDEPMVVENGPLSLDIGQKHADRPGLFEAGPVANTWLRKASDPTRILVLVKKPNGDVEDFKTTALDTHAGPVIFTLRKPGSADEPTVTLEWGGLTQDELTIKPSDGLTLDRVVGAHRRLKPSLNVQIARIDWNIDDNNQDFVDLRSGGGGVRHDSVFVAMF